MTWATQWRKVVYRMEGAEVVQNLRIGPRSNPGTLIVGED